MATVLCCVDHPIDVDDGRTVGAGGILEDVDVDPDSAPVAAARVADGQLVVLEAKPAESAGADAPQRRHGAKAKE
jgi:hypothetical protein